MRPSRRRQTFSRNFRRLQKRLRKASQTSPLPQESIRDRQTYLLNSRNLALGAWDESRGGFLGIRTKFGSKFVDLEYFYGPKTGTAKPQLDLNVTVPEWIPLTEHLGTCCTGCNRDVEFRDQCWFYRDSNIAICGYPLGRANDELFEFLNNLTTAVLVLQALEIL